MPAEWFLVYADTTWWAQLRADCSPWFHHNEGEAEGGDDQEGNGDGDSLAEYADKQARLARIRELLPRLPAGEADAFDLAYLRGIKQWDIGRILNPEKPLTQAGVSYRLQQARWRMGFLVNWAGIDMTPEQMTAALTPHLHPLTVQVLAGMLVTSSQSAVAAQLGITQGKVHARFKSAVQQLDRLRGEQRPELDIYYRTFDQLIKNPGVLCTHPNPRRR